MLKIRPLNLIGDINPPAACDSSEVHVSESNVVNLTSEAAGTVGV